MKFERFLYNSKAFIKRQSPTILCCFGAVGVIATAIGAAKATPKALLLIKEAERKKESELTAMEKIKVAWKPYAPVAIIGSATISCIFGANVLNRRQQASLASAYMFLENSFNEYKEKVKEKIGSDEERDIRTSIVKKKLEDADIPLLGGEVLMFYEEHHGQIFERTMLEVRDAEYQLNRKITLNGEASLNELLELLDLPGVKEGDSIGWSQDDAFDFSNFMWVDFDHELVTLDDGMECYIISTSYLPSLLVPF